MGMGKSRANRKVGDQARCWPIAAPQGALISGFRVWAAQGRYAAPYWHWGVPWGALLGQTRPFRLPVSFVDHGEMFG